MRKVQSLQSQLGSTDIASIQLDLKSRDDIPQILRGLQHIYISTESHVTPYSNYWKHIFSPITLTTMVDQE